MSEIARLFPTAIVCGLSSAPAVNPSLAACMVKGIAADEDLGVPLGTGIGTSAIEEFNVVLKCKVDARRKEGRALDEASRSGPRSPISEQGLKWRRMRPG